MTAAGKTRRLPEPFIVLATQNPIEREKTYPLPEAELGRFMVQLTVGYPSREDEERIVAETTTDDSVDVRPVLTAAQLSELLHFVRRLPAAPVVRIHSQRTRDERTRHRPTLEVSRDE